MEFTYTEKAKDEILKLRIKHDPEIALVNTIMKVLCIVAVVIGLFVALFVYIGCSQDIVPIQIRDIVWLFPLFAWGGIMFTVWVLSLIRYKMAMSFFDNCYSEKLYYKNEYLIFRYFTSLGGGVNYFREGNEIYELVIPINSINNLLYCQEMKEVVFKGSVYASRYTRGGQKIGQTRLDANKTVIFFDYFTPSLFEFLTKNGIPYERKELSKKQNG